MQIFLIGKQHGFEFRCPKFRNTLSGYNSTETVSGILRNLRKAIMLVVFLSTAAQNILISRVSIWELFALTLGNLPTGNKQPFEHFGSTN